MSIFSSRYRYTETLSATGSILEILDGRHSNNGYVQKTVEQLQVHENHLRASIAYHDQGSLAQESDTLDEQFNRAFKKFRNFADMMSENEEFGEIAVNCAVISSVITNHDRELHQKPKDIQISLFDSVVTELNPTENGSVIDQAGIRQLFTPLYNIHTELKEIETTRSSVAATAETIPAPYEVARLANPLLLRLHRHISEYADLGDESYAETLTMINTKLAPLVTRVKSRITRAENRSETTAE